MTLMPTVSGRADDRRPWVTPQYLRALEGIRQDDVEAAQQVIPRDDPSLEKHYPPNTWVYAGCLQDKTSMMNPDGSSMFTRRVLAPFEADLLTSKLEGFAGWKFDGRGLLRRLIHITSEKAKALNTLPQSLCEAVERVKPGWINLDYDRPQVPVLSKGNRPGFLLADNAKVQQGEIQRYVVLISGEGAEIKNNPEAKTWQENGFTMDAARVRRIMTHYFAVPDDNRHFLMLSPQSGEKVLDTIRDWLSQVKNPEQVELLIYYSGHGEKDRSYRPQPQHRFLQGSQRGILYTAGNEPLEEEALKDFMVNTTAGLKHVALMMDACHSAALVASRGNNRKLNPTQLA